MKSLSQNRMNSKIKQREKMSELASNSFMQMDDKSKDRLIDRNIQDKSFINELGSKIDPIMEKAKNTYLDREYLQQQYLNKYVGKEKHAVKDYYNKYVE